MQNPKQQFIELALKEKALCFGEFTLKSGRISPYFFNAGVFNSSHSIAAIGRFFAHLIQEKFCYQKDYDMLFGPAYKGIPLVVATAIALATEHQLNVPFCFNRKEAKDHGEGGIIVGAPLKGKVLLIDDVITAGTAINASHKLIESHNATLSGVTIMLDRQEKNQQQHSSLKQIEQQLGAKVESIAAITDIISYLQQADNSEQLASILSYQQRYGINQ
jgi:orotate phosphoribosyltransferase